MATATWHNTVHATVLERDCASYINALSQMTAEQTARFRREMDDYRNRASRSFTVKLSLGIANESVVFLNLYTPPSAEGADDWAMLAMGIEPDGSILGEND
jgi:hypothetical protein